MFEIETTVGTVTLDPEVYTEWQRKSGGTRHAYLSPCGKWVVKQARYSTWTKSVEWGEKQNKKEAGMYAERTYLGTEGVKVPVAECHLLPNGDLLMERVKTVVDIAPIEGSHYQTHAPDVPLTYEDDLPAWTWHVDSSQVGYDRHGELVAYDV